MLAILDGTVTDASQAQIPVTDDGLAARRRRLRGHAPLRRAAVRARRPPDAPGALGGEPAPAGRPRGRARRRRDAARAQRRAGRRAARRGHARRAPPGDRRGAQAAARHARAGHDRVRADARARRQSSRSPTARTCSPRRLAQEQGADEALLVTPHGRVLEGPTTSFVCSLDGETLVTPPLSEHILDSITRRHLLGVVEVDRAGRSPATSCAACARRSWPRRCARCTRCARSTAPRCRRRPAPLTQERREPDPRAHRAGAGRLRLTLARPHRHREPAAVRQGRGRLAPAARASTTSCSSTPASTTTTSCRRSSSTSSASRAPSASWASHGGTNTEQTARMLAALGPLLADERPDVVLVYGDTNSTLAGGLAAAQARVPVAHVEAGHALVRPRDARGAQPRPHRPPLRRCCSCPSPTAVANLERERVAGRVELVGDVMVDVALLFQPRARGRRRAAARRRASRRASTCSPPRTARATSTTPRACARWSTCCSRCRWPVVLPLHPRTRARLEAAGLARRARGRRARPPACRRWATSPSPRCSSRARAVLTDSGGVQKEAYLAGVPCVTLRDTTEWVETVDVGLERARRPRRRRGAGRAGAHAAGRAPRALRRRARGRRASSPRSPR